MPKPLDVMWRGGTLLDHGRWRLRNQPKRVVVVGVAAATVVAVAVPAWAARGRGGVDADVRVIQFPVDGKASYQDDFGACRDGCSRYHQGNDLIAARGTPIVSPVDGVLDWVYHDVAQTSTCGNGITVVDRQGWRYVGCHLNNDSPGTDDNANRFEQAFAPGIAKGVAVKRGQLLGWVGDSGNAEFSVPHLHFEIRNPSKTAIDPYKSLMLSQGRSIGANRCRFSTNPTTSTIPTTTTRPAGTTTTTTTAPTGSPTSSTTTTLPLPQVKDVGYWVLGRDGGVFTYGDAAFYGSTGGMRLNKPVVGMAPTPTGKGYWLVASDGGIFSFGDAVFHGSTGAIKLNKPVNGMAATTSGKGYWLVASDGGIFAFGDALFYGSTGAMSLDDEIIAMATHPSGEGYWLLEANGTVHAFGAAATFGDLGDHEAAKGKVARGITPTASGDGYWILATDGSVEAFGDAEDFGDLTGEGLCTVPTPMGIYATHLGHGYVIAATDGTVWVYGDALWAGDLLDSKIVPNAPVLGVSISDRRAH